MKSDKPEIIHELNGYINPKNKSKGFYWFPQNLHKDYRVWLSELEKAKSEDDTRYAYLAYISCPPTWPYSSHRDVAATMLNKYTKDEIGKSIVFLTALKEFYQNDSKGQNLPENFLLFRANTNRFMVDWVNEELSIRDEKIKNNSDELSNSSIKNNLEKLPKSFFTETKEILFSSNTKVEELIQAFSGKNNLNRINIKNTSEFVFFMNELYKRKILPKNWKNILEKGQTFILPNGKPLEAKVLTEILSKFKTEDLPKRAEHVILEEIILKFLKCN